MARRKLKPEPVSPPPAGEVVADPTAAEAEAHARASTVTDPAAFELPIPPADAPTPRGAAGSEEPAREPARLGEGKAWNPRFGLRADHEVGVGLLEDKRFKQMQIRFAEKPSDEVRRVVREAGFQWRSQEEAWAKRIDPDKGWRTRAEAEALYDRVTVMIRAERGLAPARDAGPQPG